MGYTSNLGVVCITCFCTSTLVLTLVTSILGWGYVLKNQFHFTIIVLLQVIIKRQKHTEKIPENQKHRQYHVYMMISLLKLVIMLTKIEGLQQ